MHVHSILRLAKESIWPFCSGVNFNVNLPLKVTRSNGSEINRSCVISTLLIK